MESSILGSEVDKVFKLSSEANITTLEFLALIAGIKPAIYYGTDNAQEIEIIRSYFPNLKISGTDFDFSSNGILPKKYIYVISRDQELSSSIIKKILDNRLYSVGVRLGYPRCCVTHHTELVQRPRCREAMVSLAKDSVISTFNSSKRYSSFANNIYNFNTRLRPEDTEKFHSFAKLNKFEGAPLARLNLKPMGSLSFISHIPCAYDCEASINLGKKLFQFMDEYVPDIARDMLFILSRPVIFFGAFEWLAFNELKKRGSLYYYSEPNYFMKSLVSDDLKNAVEYGDSFLIDDENVIIKKSGADLYRYKKTDPSNGIVIDFSSH